MMHTAAYMAWAKSRPHSPIDLALSNVPPCALEDLPGAREALDVAGRNDDGYPPLVDAIADRYGTTPACVATATGTSGANFLVCLALLRAGDEVLVEAPAYDPLLAVVRSLGARAIRFERRFEDGFDVDPAAVARALTPGTTLVVLTHPHNPSGALVRDDALAAIADRAGLQARPSLSTRCISTRPPAAARLPRRGWPTTSSRPTA
jgi:aspartate/methionine/tyrosine aminotransferase